MCDSAPNARYSSVCNVLHQRSISLITTYRVYQLYDNNNYYNKQKHFLEQMKCDVGMMIDCDVTEKSYENKVGMSSY